MECEVKNIIQMPNHNVFFVSPKNTYCNGNVITDEQVDLSKVRPILFDSFTKQYRKLGDSFAQCWHIGVSKKASHP